MRFTRQDAITFGLGLAAAAVVPLADSLMSSSALFEDAGAWVRGLAVGVLAAAGRYLVTRVVEGRPHA